MCASGAARLSRLGLQAHLAWCAVGALLAARGHGEGALLTLLCQAETNTFAVSALLDRLPSLHDGAIVEGMRINLKGGQFGGHINKQIMSTYLRGK